MRLRVMTYNIHKCVGALDRRLEPERVAEVIAGHEPDVVLLQEAARLEAGPGAGVQAEWLARRLKMRHLAWRAPVPIRRGGSYGNAILSRFPVTQPFWIDLTVPWKKRRGALHARIRVRTPSGRGRTLHAFNFHLGLSGLERRWQLRRFLRTPALAGLHERTPVLVGGDFNDVWATLGPALLYPAGFRGHAGAQPTFPSYAPLRALDALYVRGDLRLLETRRSRLALARSASDHLPVVAELELD